MPPNVSAEVQRDMARLGFVTGQIRDIEDARRKRLDQQPETGPHPMVRLLNRVVGVGTETADMLVHEVLSRPMRDRKAMARYAGLTGSPDESGAQRREQGLARAGNARVPHGSSPWAEGPRGMIQLAWRFLLFSEAERTGTVVPGPHCRLKSHGLTRLRADSRDKRRAPAFLPS